MQPIPLQAIDSASVTIVLDNAVDMLLGNQGPAKRLGTYGRLRW